jgi:hypothetical protein
MEAEVYMGIDQGKSWAREPIFTAENAKFRMGIVDQSASFKSAQSG